MNLMLIVLLIGISAVVSATSAEEGSRQGRYHNYRITDKNYLKQYKEVLSLFKYIHQPAYSKQHVDIAREYSIEKNLDHYSNTEAVKELLNYYRHGMLPRDEVFSTFYEYHLKQAIALFKVFYHAKDFDTFYKTAVWARCNLNQGLFLYSYSVAIVHRPDTYSIVLPPIYEIYPYYFFNTEVIQKAQQYKQLYVAGTQYENIIYANYSGWYLNVHPEQSLSYFTEDVGINAYYYYYNLYRPSWLKNSEYGINSYYAGEEFYYFYQQFLARYYLERLSNDFGEVPVYDYQDAFETGYYPSLRYANGLEFPQRSNWVYFFTNYYNHGQSFSFKGKFPYSYYKVMDYERRIRDAIDLGYVYKEDGEKVSLFKPDGFNVLGNIIESNPESPNSRFYGHLQVFARHLLGYSYQPLSEYKVAPSALEHFETSLRDPAFWQLYKRLILYFQKYKFYLPKYTHKDLYFPNVKVEAVEVDRLTTYFENYDIDISNVVYVNQNEYEHNSFSLYARQRRLNHKPFSYKIKVTSSKLESAIVRVFIGPKYDEFQRDIRIDENRINFVEFDRFPYELKPGKNTIERNSQETFYASDRTTYRQLYKKVLAGVNSGEEFSTHGSEVYSAFPNRFLLPKGKQGGQTYQFYVIVSPYTPPTLFNKKKQDQEPGKSIYEKLHGGQEYTYFKYPMVGLGVQYLDNYSLGFPFDRTIIEESNFNVPNSYFKDVIIYHKQGDDINKSTYVED